MNYKTKASGKIFKNNYIVFIDNDTNSVISVEKIIDKNKQAETFETISSTGVKSKYTNEKLYENKIHKNSYYRILLPDEYIKQFEPEYKMCNMKIETHRIIVDCVKRGGNEQTNKQTAEAKRKEISKYIKIHCLFEEFIDTLATL